MILCLYGRYPLVPSKYACMHKGRSLFSCESSSLNYGFNVVWRRRDEWCGVKHGTNIITKEACGVYEPDGVTDFAMIHDSYGCHAGYASLLRDNLRQAFVDQYSKPVLDNFRNELLEQLPPELQEMLPELPPMGDLDLEQVKHSEYFFA